MTTPVLSLDKIHISRYRPLLRFIPDGGSEDDEITLNVEVVEISIVRRFLHYMLPYVRIKCVLPVEKSRRIQEEYEGGSVFLTLERVKFAPDSGEDGEDTGEMYWEDVELTLLGVDSTPLSTLRNTPETEKTPISSMDLELVPRASLEMGRKTSNRIFQDIRILDALVMLFKERLPSIPYRFLISPSDSTRIYENIIIPPLPLAETVSYLNEVYGLYKQRMTFFLDADTGYLLCADKPLEDKRLLPMKEVQIELFGAPQGIGGYGIANGGFDDPEAQVYHMRTSWESHLEYQNVSQNEVVGEKMRFMRDSEEVMHLRASENATRLAGKRGAEKERIIWQRYDNDLFGEGVAARKREGDFQLTIVGESADLRYLVPHLPYRVMTGFEEMGNLEGLWRPINVDIRMTKDPGSRMSMGVYYAMTMVRRDG